MSCIVDARSMGADFVTSSRTGYYRLVLRLRYDPNVTFSSFSPSTRRILGHLLDAPPRSRRKQGARRGEGGGGPFTHLDAFYAIGLAKSAPSQRNNRGIEADSLSTPRQRTSTPLSVTSFVVVGDPSSILDLSPAKFRSSS